jgi:hypothetical protein
MAAWQNPGVLSKQKRLPDPAEIELARLDSEPAYVEVVAALTALERRLAETQARRKRARAQLMGAKPVRSTLARAKDLVAGGRIEATDPGDEIKACDAEELVLREAVIQTTAKLDEVSRDLSYAASQKIKSSYNSALLAILHSIEELAAGLDTAAAIRAKLWAAGYQPSGVILPELAPHEAMVLGSPANIGGSPAWYYRRALERLGIL